MRDPRYISSIEHIAYNIKHIGSIIAYGTLEHMVSPYACMSVRMSKHSLCRHMYMLYLGSTNLRSLPLYIPLTQRSTPTTPKPLQKLSSRYGTMELWTFSVLFYSFYPSLQLGSKERTVITSHNLTSHLNLLFYLLAWLPRLKVKRCYFSVLVRLWILIMAILRIKVMFFVFNFEFKTK